MVPNPTPPKPASVTLDIDPCLKSLSAVCVRVYSHGRVRRHTPSCFCVRMCAGVQEESCRPLTPNPHHPQPLPPAFLWTQCHSHSCNIQQVWRVIFSCSVFRAKAAHQCSAGAFKASGDSKSTHAHFAVPFRSSKVVTH